MTLLSNVLTTIPAFAEKHDDYLQQFDVEELLIPGERVPECCDPETSQARLGLAYEEGGCHLYYCEPSDSCQERAGGVKTRLLLTEEICQKVAAGDTLGIGPIEISDEVRKSLATPPGRLRLP